MPFSWRSAFLNTGRSKRLRTAPAKLLIKNGGMKAKAPACFPRKTEASGTETRAPRIPVPITSPTAAADGVRIHLYKRPASKAPIMLPGNASTVPIPSRLRISAIIKAIITAGPGPSVTAAITLTACCTGYALATPAGNQRKLEPTMPMATQRAIIVRRSVEFVRILIPCLLCIVRYCLHHRKNKNHPKRVVCRHHESILTPLPYAAITQIRFKGSKHFSQPIGSPSGCLYSIILMVLLFFL